MNNAGMYIVGIAEILLFAICAFIFRVDLSAPLIAVPGVIVVGAAIYLFTNKEDPPQPSRIVISVVLFALCLIIILAVGASHRANAAQGL
jgi:hypothetical protein